MIRRASFIAALALLATATARAEGVPPPVVSAVTPTGYRVHVPVGEPVVRSGDVYGAVLSEIEIPGGVADAPAGTPQLPVRMLAFRIPWGVEPRVRATPGAARPLGAMRPVPLPYLLSAAGIRESTSAAEVARWLAGAPYLEGSSTSWSPLLDARPAAAGSERFLQIRLAPVRWDPRTGAAEAADAVDLDVSWDRPVAPVEDAGARPNSLTPLDALGPHYAPVLRPPAGPRGGSAPSRPGSVAAPALGPAPAVPVRVTPAFPWVRLGVTRPGLYALSPADLAAAGVTTAGIDPATFRVLRAPPGDLSESVDVDLGPDGLQECAIVVTGEGDGLFDPSDRIYFYATGSSGFGADLALGRGGEYEESQRSGEESLWLTWGAGPVPGAPRRMSTRDGRASPPGTPFSVVTHRVHFEANRFYFPSLFTPGLRWERWFYELLAQGFLPVRYIMTLPGAEPGGSASLRSRVWGKLNSVGTVVFDHYLNVSWDRVPVATAAWNQSTPQDLAASGFAVGSRDTIDFDVPVVPDPNDVNRNDQSLLAWFEVTYPRRLLAVNDTLSFVAPDSLAAGRATYSVGGASDTASVWLLDRTDPESPVRVTGTWSGGTAPYTLAATDSVGPGYRPRYALVSTARAAPPATVQRYAPASGAYVLPDLLDPSNGVDYLIVAPDAFLAPAQTLAAYRAGNLSGMPAPRVGIATMDRVAAQFGAGLADPVAIRNLLVYARRYWSGPGPLPGSPPTYVCLLGDATLDPRDYFRFAIFGDRDWVPTYANYYDPSIQVQFVSDDWFGFLDGPGDQLLDMAIGRLPAKSTAEALALVSGKARTYEGTVDLDPWRARALLAADDASKRADPDPVGNGHVLQMERKDRQHLPYPIERSKVYLNDYAWADTTHLSKPAAREEFIARVNQGNWLVDFIGHGSENVIADEQLFRLSDDGRLSNAQRPSIFGFFSCTVGKFDQPGAEGEGLGERLLKMPGGGAAASLAATEAVFPNESTRLNDSFVEEVFPLRPRVDSLVTAGLAWARAKNANVNIIARKYALLGDPGLRPPVPRGWGAWDKAPLDSVLRGDVVTITGRALNPDSTLDPTASGTALIQIQGPPFRRRQGGLSGIGTPDTVTYFVPGPVLYRGTVPLSQGRFTATFVVPVDGRIAGRGGQLRALLSSAGGRGVGLAVDSLRIAVGAAARVDQTPPAISLLYPSASDSAVQAGSRLTIVLEDSSGIDLMRLDNAHTIFVVLDELRAPIELTPAFQYDSGSHTRGSVEFIPTDLGDGPHLLEVHASDTYRNIAVRTFVLDVRAPFAAGDPLFLTQVFNYPNPFAGATYVHARLNQPARLRIQLLTVAGRRVRELTADGRAGENYIPWDGLDSTGEKVAIGVYLIRVVAEAPGGKRATAVGRALRKE